MTASGDQSAVSARGKGASRRAMALRGFLCQNVAIGCTFGSFGVAVPTLQRHYGVGSAMASLCLALVVMMMGLGSPLVGRMIERIGLRATMLTGLVLTGLGYVALAYAPSFPFVLLAYALPIGLGLAMFGPFPASVLAARWFQPNPGAAIGFVNTPVLGALVPMAIAPLLTALGLTGLFLLVACVHVLLLPVIHGIADPPESADAPVLIQAVSIAPPLRVLSRPLFWLIAVGSGILYASGVTGSSHVFALGIESGLGTDSAAMLLSIMGAASIAGAFGAGMLCSRIGAPLTLALIAGSMALAWLALLSLHEFAHMAPLIGVLGAGASGVFPVVNVLVGQGFGLPATVRVVGLLGLATLPLSFGLPPLVGMLHDTTGGYAASELALSAGCGLVAVIFLAVARWSAGRSRNLSPAF